MHVCVVPRAVREIAQNGQPVLKPQPTGPVRAGGKASAGGRINTINSGSARLAGFESELAPGSPSDAPNHQNQYRDGPQVHHPQRRQHGRRAAAGRAPDSPQTIDKLAPRRRRDAHLCAQGWWCVFHGIGRPRLFDERRGTPQSQIRQRVDRAAGWQHDLELVEDKLLLGGGIGAKAWDAQTGAQVAAAEPPGHAMRERLRLIEWRQAATTGSVGSTYRERRALR